MNGSLSCHSFHNPPLINTPIFPRTQEDNRRLKEEEGRAAQEEEKGALQGPVMMAGRAPAPEDDKDVDA